ncbi:DUF3108 domain-containing protein [Salinimicrobium flavum]|uniref:DUF3108 domain-containing protein n=1 Tax=Salinimicrobium flavum TaxID=1737065 RepID=A0ABW5IU41_9FLAO
MKKIFTIIISLVVLNVTAQSHQAFADGEWFRFRIHYGVFNASFATLEVKETTFKNKPVYHVVGKGKSTGLLHLFFKVDDNYETFVDKNTGSPLRFIRQIDEGGHTKDIQIDFDHSSNTAHVFNRKHNTHESFTVQENVHDMLSSFYYLRNNLNVDDISPGEMMTLNMFFDNENHDFKLKFLGREVVKTKMGNIAALKFKPYVLAGRVFKEKESLTIWVSDDGNRMPVKIKADLAVGSLDASLDAFKGLKHPLKIIMK